MPTPTRLTAGRLLTTMALAVASTLAPAGCSSRQEVADRLSTQDRPPEDFALALTVLTPAKQALRPDQLPRGQRPARYLMGANGALAVSQGIGASTRDFPPVVRVLRDAQRQEIWAMIKDAGLLRSDAPGRQRGSETGGDAVDPFKFGVENPDRPIALLAIQFGRERDYFRIGLPEEPKVEALADRLAALAWIR
jgi:hypothetical protein